MFGVSRWRLSSVSGSQQQRNRARFAESMSAKSSAPSPSLDLDPVAQRILFIARRQFRAHGFKNVIMDDLASDMGMSKKILYAHFPSKSALVKSMLTQKLDEAEMEHESSPLMKEAAA
jgi:AcrR family transcriptional regulator